MPSTPPSPSFDPFADQRAPSANMWWLWATGVQAFITLGLLGLERFAEGKPWEQAARLITLFGIIATWSLALRAIRERLVELLRFWHKASQGLFKQASKSGRHLITRPLTKPQERLIKDTIWRLRIIAAGLSIPFFVMPLFWMVLSVVFHFSMETIPARDYWASVAMVMVFSAAIVAGYVHWVLVPQPVPVRVSAFNRSMSSRRFRRG